MDGKVALITGGTSGIGEASVEVFVEAGAKVVFVGRNEEAGAEIEKRLGGAASFFKADVTKEMEIKAAVEHTVEKHGRLDTLFSNAGGRTYGTWDTVTGEDFRHAMDLLLGSVVFGIKYAAPIMVEQGRGAIINNSSIAAMRTHMGGYLYSIAKAAVTQATKVAGMELGRHGVTVNCISPGGIATPIFLGGSDIKAGLDPEKAEAKMAKLAGNLAKATPMLTSGLPRDIAYGALYLASDEGRFVNCHDLVIDAGMTAGGRTNFEDLRPGAPV